MADGEKKNDVQINRQNISYYDGIAADYDSILNEDATNSLIRSHVAAYFTSLVKGGTILDFGGGTGRDLDWLIQQPYRIVFCEPSAPMRQIAIDRKNREFPGAPISFLDENKTDFRQWNARFPFEERPNAVLANFAVINCIPDIGLLFEKLAGVIGSGGMVFALLLDSRFTTRLRFSIRAGLKSFLTGHPMSFFVDHNGRRQQVYFHSVASIQKATGNYYEWKIHAAQPGSGFRLIHLIRK